jgi:hypothetical protein
MARPTQRPSAAAMNWPQMGTAIALGGGFFAANALRFKRGRDLDGRRLAMGDEVSRWRHFRGRVDMELGTGQPTPDPDQ